MIKEYKSPFKKWGKSVEKVVSLDSLKLRGIEKKNKSLIFGSMVTLQEISDSELVPGAIRDAARFIPTRSVRNIATIGGNVGAGRPDSYIIPVLIASSAFAELADGALVPVEKYVTHGLEDLIINFQIPEEKNLFIKAIKESRSFVALPVVSAAVSISAVAGKISKVIIAVGCVSSKCIRLTDVENRIVDGTLKDGTELEDAIAKSLSPSSNSLGSATYKRYINSVSLADVLRAGFKEVLF
jgi:putative selenate reductase FAD-binding subunit